MLNFEPAKIQLNPNANCYEKKYIQDIFFDRIFQKFLFIGDICNMIQMLSSFFKKTGLLLLSLAVFFSSCVKNRYTWSTEKEYYKRPMWKAHVRNFRKIKMAPNTAKVFIGDSITEGFDLRRHLNDSTTVNMGIGGDFTSGVLKRIDIAAKLKPAKIFVMIGINDILKDIDQSRIENNYSQIISYVKEHCSETKIYIQSNLPTTAMGGNDESNLKYADRVQNLNIFLQGLCTANGITFVNLYPYFEIPGMKINPECAYDGLHLSDNGYKVWSELIKDIVNAEEP